MATLYVASTETFVGKSAVCLGLMRRLQRDGFRAGYMKPVSASIAHRTEAALDADAALVATTMGLTAPVEQLAPILITPGVVDAILRGQRPAFRRRLQDAFLALSRDRDILLLEGSNSWSEGALADLSADQVMELLETPGLLVSRYHSTLAIDTILAVQRYVGDRLSGVLLNQVAEPQLDFVQQRVVPFLEARDIPVLGVIPHDQILAGVTVRELHDHLGGQLIGSRDWYETMVESLMVGAMSAEAGQAFFQRREHKAVITGGDRADLQLAALETSTSLLILTGNVQPPMQVIDKAEECRVPIIVLPDETGITLERAEALFGQSRLQRGIKIERFSELLELHLDVVRLYDLIGLTP
jgi:hypothetical protein